ncbi:MAG: MerR family transcriptional regulator [Bacteroidia bacterium]|nr:MerR family transcriptional regulator [Bacteroidia bacterium]
MEFTEPDESRLYFSISEVAVRYNVQISTIRHWSNQFEVLNPHKNKKGNRSFTREDIRYLDIIYRLLKEQGLTIDGARKKLKENPEETLRNTEIINKLKTIKEFIHGIERQLEEKKRIEL